MIQIHVEDGTGRSIIVDPDDGIITVESGDKNYIELRDRDGFGMHPTLCVRWSQGKWIVHDTGGADVIVHDKLGL